MIDWTQLINGIFNVEKRELHHIALTRVATRLNSSDKGNTTTSKDLKVHLNRKVWSHGIRLFGKRTFLQNLFSLGKEVIQPAIEKKR